MDVGLFSILLSFLPILMQTSIFIIVLTPDRISPPASFFLLMISLTVFDLLHSDMNFKISLSISTQTY